MPYDPGPDVIAVQRGPQPGGAGGAYRAFGETLRGLKTTFGRLVEGFSSRRPNVVFRPRSVSPNAR